MKEVQDDWSKALIVTGNRIWVVRWLSVLRISRYFHFLSSSALFPLTSVVVGPGLCTLDSAGFWLVTCCPCWPLIGPRCPSLTGYSALMHSNCCSGCPVFRPIFAHLWWLLTFYIFVAHSTLNRLAPFITEITLLSIILVSQLAFPVLGKFDSGRDISLDIRPPAWLETKVIIWYKVAKCNSRRSLCWLCPWWLGGRYWPPQSGGRKLVPRRFLGARACFSEHKMSALTPQYAGKWFTNLSASLSFV